jgi:predicted NBD/HSP70 family sugar kinase
MSSNPLGNRELIRAINRSTVLNTIKTHGSISRVEIARQTGLSAATVTGITAELISNELIFEKEEGDSRGGRRPILLAINPRGGYVVGIKLMEDHAIGAITDLEATIISKYSSDLKSRELTHAIDVLVGIVNYLVRETKIEREKLYGVGVGLAGIVDARKGVLRYSPIFGWRDVSLAELLESHLNVQIYIDNDVNTLTLNEQLFGSGQGIGNFLTVTIGRGVGLGIVVNGQLYRGVSGGGGEFGHTVIDKDGKLCPCGNRGCLETFVSDPALLRLASEAWKRGEIPEKIETMDELIRSAHEGISASCEIFRQAGEKIGHGIANLINILCPEEIIISGEGVRAADLLFEPMRNAISQCVMPALVDDTSVRIDLWEDDAWARGAASLVLQEIFKSPLHGEKVEGY